MSLSKLEMACSVYFGEFANSDDLHLESTENPESQFIIKETLSRLSNEAKLMLKTIMELPDEAFRASGDIIIRELYSYMKRRYSWDRKNVNVCRKELATAFGINL